MKESILKKFLMNTKIKRTYSLTLVVSVDMKEFTQEKNHMNVRYTSIDLSKAII